MSFYSEKNFYVFPLAHLTQTKIVFQEDGIIEQLYLNGYMDKQAGVVPDVTDVIIYLNDAQIFNLRQAFHELTVINVNHKLEYGLDVKTGDVLSFTFNWPSGAGSTGEMNCLVIHRPYSKKDIWEKILEVLKNE